MAASNDNLPGSVPPSTGKTITIAGTVPLAFQDLLYTVLHDVWGFSWATPNFTANLMIVAVALAGVFMHHTQRKKEDEIRASNQQVLRDFDAGTNGGPANDSMRDTAASAA